MSSGRRPDHRALRVSLALVVMGALVGSICSSLSVYPHSLSYFNELSGGPFAGDQHLLGSNYDYGQNLVLLSQTVSRLGLQDRLIPVVGYPRIPLEDVDPRLRWMNLSDGIRHARTSDSSSGHLVISVQWQRQHLRTAKSLIEAVAVHEPGEKQVAPAVRRVGFWWILEFRKSVESETSLDDVWNAVEIRDAGTR